MNKDRFYFACLRDNVGSNVGFHAIDGRGYTTNLSKAHQYTKAEAQRAWDLGRDFEVPINSDLVDAMAVAKVDCQLIPVESCEVVEGGRYYAFAKGQWDGNDLFWVTDNGEFSTDLKLADALTGEQLNAFHPSWFKRVTVVEADLVESSQRRTFAYSQLNRRKLTQPFGLVTPGHIKRSKRRKPDPKVRWNCPSCGQINWQHNPYDFEGCSSLNCEEWAYNH